MKFSLYVLLGIWLWNGAFFLTQTGAQTLREELKEELRKELREELKEELREEEKIRQNLKELRQEIHEEFTIPCGKPLFKKCQSYPARYECEKGAKKLLVKFEDELLDKLYDKSENERLAWYFVIRRNCEQQFDSEE